MEHFEKYRDLTSDERKIITQVLNWEIKGKDIRLRVLADCIRDLSIHKAHAENMNKRVDGMLKFQVFLRQEPKTSSDSEGEK